MKKVAAVFVSIGVILVIAGLVMVGIFGGDTLKNFSWGDWSGVFNHNLESADTVVDYGVDELNGLSKIELDVDNYSVYILPADEEKLSVKYINPNDDDISIQVAYDQNTSVLKVTERDNERFHFWGISLGTKRFIAVYIPQTEMFVNASLTANASTAGIKVANVSFASVKCFAKTGSVNIDGITVDVLNAETNTGSVNLDKITCRELSATTNTGSVNVDGISASGRVELRADTGSINCDVTADALYIDTDTGSINFDATANSITVKTDTGSVHGTVLGDKNDYNITTRVGTGKSNLSNQTAANGSNKVLNVTVDTGYVRIDFKADA